MFLTRAYLPKLILCLLLLPSIACTPVPNPTQVPLSAFSARAKPLLAERRYSEAAAIFEQAAQVHADNPDPLIKIGQIYLVQHRWLLAEDAFNRALARGLDKAQAAAGLAETLLNQGRLSEALKWWQQAASLDPEQPGVYTGLGRTHLFLFDFEAAQAAFLEQQAHTPDFEAAWYLTALTAPLDLSAAVDYLQTIPSDENKPGMSASLVARRDYLWETLAPFTATSSQAEVARSTGIAMAQIELWPLAIYALSIAVKQAAVKQAAVEQAAVEQAAVEQATVEQVSELTPEAQAEALAFLGYASVQAGRPAYNYFEQALQLDPNSALPLYFEGRYLRQKGALQTAEASFEQAIELDPQNAGLYAEIAQIKEEQGNLVTAELWYTTAIEVAEEKLPFQLLMLKFYTHRNYRMSEAGIPLAETLIQADENNAEVYDLLGWMQFLSGMPEDGEEALRQALTTDPDLISARYHLARLVETTGRFDLAQEEYQRVVDWDTSGVFRDQALKDLLRLDAH
jgi:tetratricopeptide (TPR) repeat protein